MIDAETGLAFTALRDMTSIAIDRRDYVNAKWYEQSIEELGGLIELSLGHREDGTLGIVTKLVLDPKREPFIYPHIREPSPELTTALDVAIKKAEKPRPDSDVALTRGRDPAQKSPSPPDTFQWVWENFGSNKRDPRVPNLPTCPKLDATIKAIEVEYPWGSEVLITRKRDGNQRTPMIWAILVNMPEDHPDPATEYECGFGDTLKAAYHDLKNRKKR